MLERVAVIRISYVSNKVRLDIATTCFTTKVDTILKISYSARRVSFRSKLESILVSIGFILSYIIYIIIIELY